MSSPAPQLNDVLELLGLVKQATAYGRSCEITIAELRTELELAKRAAKQTAPPIAVELVKVASRDAKGITDKLHKRQIVTEEEANELAADIQNDPLTLLKVANILLEFSPEFNRPAEAGGRGIKPQTNVTKPKGPFGPISEWCSE